MPNTSVKRGAAKVRHLGRHKVKIERYYEKQYPMKKIRNILKNNGVPMAQSWAAKHGVIVMFDDIVKERKERIHA